MPNIDSRSRDFTDSPSLSRSRQTGPKRTHLPVYLDRLPPCNHACPVDAIIKLGPGKRYRYDYERCTGSAIFYAGCRCGAIEMDSAPAHEITPLISAEEDFALCAGA